MSVPSAEIPDLSREHKACLSWDPARALLASLRAYEQHRYSANPVSWLLKKMAVLRHRFWSVVAGADIPLGSKIAGGLLLPHANGIVIHPEALIGPNCLIFQQVTIGTRGPGGAPHYWARWVGRCPITLAANWPVYSLAMAWARQWPGWPFSGP